MSEAPTIVSLIASATEIVCALGLRDRLVGISHECDFPLDVQNLPVLSQPMLDPKLPGAKIDRRVRELVRDGLSVYRVDVEALESLGPDLIITQDHCEVCAVSLQDVEKATQSVTLKNTKICSLHPSRLQDVVADFQKVADSASVSERGHQLTARFLRRLETLREKTGSLDAKPKVACLEWLNPPMLAAGWMRELVEIAGGRPVVVDRQKAFSTIRWADLVDLDPDLIVLMPCGYPIQQTLRELEDSDLARTLRQFRATAEQALWLVDGNAYFNRPGPRLADSTEILAGLVHPTAFPEFRERYAASFSAWN